MHLYNRSVVLLHDSSIQTKSKQSENPLKRHSGEGRNPMSSEGYGCRIKSGMTNSDFHNTVNSESLKKLIVDKGRPEAAFG
jgi:hypothetical protein